LAIIFVVDDEPSICWGIKELGESMGHEVETFSSVEKTLQSTTRSVDLAIVDVRLPGMTGLDGIAHLREKWKKLPIIVMTAYGNLSTAVTAIKNGAFEYVLKPFDLDLVQTTIERALELNQTPTRDSQTSEGQSGINNATSSAPDSIVGNSQPMQKVFRQIALASDSTAAVLLHGESGTGKELVARAIHKNSDRCESPFVAVNLASLSSALAESELFGHAQGAFTGADQARSGLLTRANGGTLFLDEVADIPVALQIKLLRALELKEFQAVGSTETLTSDFRIVSASHRHLRSLVKSGEFRHDLFYRLSAFEIEIPSLRQRSEDIAELAAAFLAQSTRNSPPPTIAPETLVELQNRTWPGNVRELRNAIEHAAIVSRGQTIYPEHLPNSELTQIFDSGEASDGLCEQLESLVKKWTELQYREHPEHSELHEKLVEEVERPLLFAVLEKCNHNFSLASRQLGMHRTTLKKKAEAYGIVKE